MNDWKSKYKKVEYIGEDLYKVSNDNQDDQGELWGVVNQDGEEITPVKYHVIDDFCKGLCRVILHSLQGFVNTKGEEAIPLIYSWANNFYVKITGVEKDGKWGFIDLTGKVVVPFKYDKAGAFDTYSGVSVVTLNKLRGIVNVGGVEVVPCEFSYFSTIDKNFLLVENPKRKFGIYDVRWNGKKILSCKYAWEYIKEYRILIDGEPLKFKQTRTVKT